ncbi:MAG: rRNA pseudouridine synthase [Oscillospiraceae bacterium]|nr:rRNA pseudouridine synthase [Oscillospiraceae bacterium]
MERLQKILSSRGVCSRRAAEALLQEGRITCNGRICQLGDSADPDHDEILVDGKPLPSAQNYIYIMLHKPRGFVTTLSDEKGRKNAAQLVADCGTRVYPVGRLDMDSEGLLLFTNDGQLANRLMHPSHEISKVYRVTVDGYSAHGLERFNRPMTLDGYRLQIPKVTLLEEKEGKAVMEITIHEGRNRQVRRMCAIAGMQVRRLLRVSEGPLQLGNLPKGKWRHLTAEELRQLQI